MNKESFFSIAGVVIIITIIIFSLNKFNKNNLYQNNQIKPTENIVYNNKKISLDEVKKHNQPNDCWLIIDKKVYNVSDYKDHPGGKKLIENFCGQDATNAFNTKGIKNKPRSTQALLILENFYLGVLNEN